MLDFCGYCLLKVLHRSNDMHKLIIKPCSFPKTSLKLPSMHNSDPLLHASATSSVRYAMNCFCGFDCKISDSLSSFHCCMNIVARPAVVIFMSTVLYTLKIVSAFPFFPFSVTMYHFPRVSDFVVIILWDNPLSMTIIVPPGFHAVSVLMGVVQKITFDAVK